MKELPVAAVILVGDRPDEFRANFTGMKDEDPNTMRSEEWVGTECRCVMYASQPHLLGTEVTPPPGTG